LGNRDGSFQAPRSIDLVGSPESLAVADFNGDGVPDLVLAGGTVSVLLGNGDGTFQAPQHFGAGRFPVSVAVADFNGDGALDLAVANIGTLSPGLPGNVSIFLGNGDGSFQTAQIFSTGQNPASIVVGSFNRDGIPDLVVTNSRSDSVSVILGRGDGSFQAPQNFGTRRTPLAVAVGDFNGDLTPDLVVANRDSNDISVLISEPSAF
jgi:hypothetical protein